MDPENPILYDLKGYALYRQKNYDEAVQTLERAIALDSKYIWGHYNLALAYWGADKRDQAVQEVRRVIELDSSFRDIIRGDGQFSKFRASEEFRKVMGEGT